MGTKTTVSLETMLLLLAAAGAGLGQYASNQAIKPYVKYNFNDTVIILIDHQVGMIAGSNTSTLPIPVLKSNVILMAKIAVAFNMSLILATANENQEYAGPTIPELQRVAPVAYSQRIARFGPINCWIVPEFVARVKSTGKKNLVFAGVTDNIAVPPPAMDAVQDGYNVKVLIDAGASEQLYEEYVMWLRLDRYGVDIITMGAFVAELVKDASGPGGAAYDLTGD